MSPVASWIMLCPNCDDQRGNESWWFVFQMTMAVVTAVVLTVVLTVAW